MKGKFNCLFNYNDFYTFILVKINSISSYEKKSMISKIKKCQHNFDQAQRLEKGYIDLAQNKFKLLEVYYLILIY
jgi:hypothetical protein